ncbi:response regulator [Shewanella sp. GXUN23E]|uniref:response regulator n=1 Tax=Shewanella sp. GXUN23E TaxID=3422498 RepID=UPI003D7EA898
MKIIEKLLLVDDHQIVREGMTALLSTMPWVHQVIPCGDGVDVMPLVRKYQPDLVLMDITLPGLNGIELTTQIKQEHPHIKVLILSMHAGAEYVAKAKLAGVDGYLIKDAAFDELANAISRVMTGEFYLSSAIDSLVVSQYQQTNDPNDPLAILTPRQKQILQLIAEGLSTRDISGRLCLSSKTVETHRAQIMARTGVKSVAGLVKIAIANGLIELE